MGFNWAIGSSEPTGYYDLLGAIRSGSDWNQVLDDTQDGPNTSLFGASSWKSAFSVTVAASMEMVLYRVSDTSGTMHTSNPGVAKSSFARGETVRVTMQARNGGPSSVGANWVLNLSPSGNHSDVRYNSDPVPNNTNEMTIPNDGQGPNRRDVVEN